MSQYKQIELHKVKTVSIARRKNKVGLKDFARVYDPRRKSFSAFIKSLPDILAAKDLRVFVNDILKAVKSRKPVIVFIGAHVIKVGLGPLLIDLMKRKIITCISMNSAAAIHDVESALWGMTSEDVEENIKDGTFGMAKETGEFINGHLNEGLVDGSAGYGEVLGKALRNAPNANISVIATAYRLKIPVTVHAAIGTDIIHQQPSMSGAATGELSFRDFKVLSNVVKDLRGGGVVMNIGSAVVLPEVFLKSLTVARNLGYKANGFTTANFDMIQHYRPRMNVVMRPTKNGGKGYMFTGHHEIMIPLLCAMIKDKLRSK
jgi:deoxyhypusine synthase